MVSHIEHDFIKIVFVEQILVNGQFESFNENKQHFMALTLSNLSIMKNARFVMILKFRMQKNGIISMLYTLKRRVGYFITEL